MLMLLCKDLRVLHLCSQYVILLPFLLQGKGDNAMIWLK